jgi:EAL domain-containing protein (putative c-di-GMP-specific phosphodiesterase class I)
MNSIASSPVVPGPGPTQLVQWYLEGLVSAEESVRQIPLNTWPFRVGRRRELALCLISPAISKEHAELRLENGELVVADLGSTNGTFVNGSQLTAPQRLKPGDIVHFGNVAFRVGLDGFDGRNPCTATMFENPGSLISSASKFDELFAYGSAMPFFQPIVGLARRDLLGYEVLARSVVEGMETPDSMFLIASKLKMADELSRMFRRLGVRGAQALPGKPNLFLNTHPEELGNADLLPSLTQLRELAPQQPLTLEIHEAAVTDLRAIGGLRSQLADLQIGLAYDDFGAGQDRLLALAEVPPDYLKFDVSFVRNVQNAAPARRRVLATLIGMVHDLGVAALAEAVETREESEICQELGFDYAQGYYFGHPASADDLLK